MTDKPTPTDAGLKSMWQLHAADIGDDLIPIRKPMAGQQVIIDFAQVGTAGPFPVVNGHVKLPGATMQDLARMLRPTYEAASGVGNNAFDHQTAADFLNGKTVSDEAVRKFVQASRWAHDEKAALSAMLLSVRGVLASREAEIALLKKALLEAETAPQPAPAPLIARSLAEWHEQDGNVAWWAWNGREWAGEPAWIGTPNCEDWPGYHTHWTPHPEQPVFAALAAQGGK